MEHNAVKQILSCRDVSKTFYGDGKCTEVIRHIDFDVTENEGTDQVKVRVEKDGDGQILPIKITANYLPEGYQEWEEGKYSQGGVFGGSGISITDGGWCADWNKTVEYILNDVSDVETLQVGDAQGVLIHREGYDYPYRMDLYYGDSGHVIIVDASQDISREELLKDPKLPIQILEDNGAVFQEPYFDTRTEE